MRRLIATALLACLAGLTLALRDLAAERLEPLAPQAAPGWLGINALTNDSLSPSGAEEPDIAISPDGSKMVVGYIKNGASLSEANPYFRTSTSSNWDAWSNPKPIHESAPIARSFQIDVTFDASGTGHAVWREDTPNPGSVNTLFYKNGGSWDNSAVNPTALSSTTPSTSPSGASTPHIEASGASTLDVIWSEDEIPTSPSPNILHIRSVNNGASWGSPTVIVNTAGNSVVPSLAVDQTGQLHAVWEEVVFIPPASFRSFIHYSQGTPGTGSAVTWTTPITISQGTTNDDSRYPDIVVDGTTLYVSYTHWLDALQAREKAHLVRCEQGCSALPSNWGLAAASTQFVNFNVRPEDSVLTSIGFGNGCAYVQYDGIPSGLPNEIIWGFSSCDAAPYFVTSANLQSTTPDVAVSGEWIHMAYEQKGSGNRHVYYVRGKLPYYVYQPIIRKGN